MINKEIYKIKGIKEIIPENVNLWKDIEKKAIGIIESYGYKEIRLPLLNKILFSNSGNLISLYQ